MKPCDNSKSGWITGSGRPMTRVGGKNWVEARLVYIDNYGPIPDGLEVLHSCDNGMCIESTHLSVGTHLQNMQDAATRGRMRRGENHPNAVLTEIEVKEILKLYSEGVDLNVISEHFGMIRNTIKAITDRKTWKHVT